jgi:2-methylcitrate dehydratase
MEAKLKCFPAENSTQSAIHAAIELRGRISGSDDIDSIVIETFDQAVDFTADADDKWNPTTRETADHSLPYVSAVALIYGTVLVAHFSEERIRDPRVHALMRKIQVRRNPEYTREHPQAQHTRMVLATKSGETYSSDIRYAKGHPKNPMTDEEITQKFTTLASPFLPNGRVEEILERLWKLDFEPSVTEILELFAVE